MYKALSPELQIAFQNYLGKEEFDKWLNRALGNGSGDTEIVPWENGGLAPSEYTYAMYEALSPELKIAFQNYLGKAEFDKWLNGALGNDSGDAEIAPWENGGIHPSLYTYQDYLNLSPAMKIKFQDYLGPVEFDKWLNRALGNTEEIAPWENGGVHPSLYTYQDYLRLSPGLKIKFQDYLGPVEFDKWLQKVNPKG